MDTPFLNTYFYTKDITGFDIVTIKFAIDFVCPLRKVILGNTMSRRNGCTSVTINSLVSIAALTTVEALCGW